MPDRIYRVAIAKTKGGLRNAAKASDGWIILQNTVREFQEMDSNDDRSFDSPPGRILVKQKGWVALAYQDA